MPSMISKDSRTFIQVLALAILVVLALFMYQGNKGFTLWDEGFLWYGVQRVMLGEVPIRDFASYDPGRYYWSAGLMNLWGNNGIMALRRTVAIFQVIGLFFGILMIARSVKKSNFLYLLLSTVTLVVWMFPRHKLFDISLSILLIAVLAFLVQNPINRRYFFVGFFVGLVAIFGRNHGIYAVVGSLGVMLWISIKPSGGLGLIKGLSLWAGGVAIGFMPVLFMVVLVPGFAVAFWDSIRYLFEIKATNIPLPIPWPWLVNFKSVPLDEMLRAVLIGLYFVGIVVFGVLAIIWVYWQKRRNKQVSPVLVAASFLALPYAHYAYSRADISHLAQGIFPLLVGCFVFLDTLPYKFRWLLAFLLCTSSVWVLYVFHPGWQCDVNKQCVSVEISGSKLQVDRSVASDIRLLRNLADLYAPEGQPFIATPVWPGAYALLERKSPMWEIYALSPRSQVFEQAEIERIKTAKPSFAMVFDLALDGRDELRFKNTHPLIYQYILDNFVLLTNSPNPSYPIYRAKDN